MSKKLTVFLAGVVVGGLLLYPLGIRTGLKSAGVVSDLSQQAVDFKKEFDESKVVLTEIGQQLNVEIPMSNSGETETNAKAAELVYGMTHAQCEGLLGPDYVVLANLSPLNLNADVLLWFTQPSRGAALTFHQDQLVHVTNVEFR